MVQTVSAIIHRLRNKWSFFHFSLLFSKKSTLQLLRLWFSVQNTVAWNDIMKPPLYTLKKLSKHQHIVNYLYVNYLVYYWCTSKKKPWKVLIQRLKSKQLKFIHSKVLPFLSLNKYVSIKKVWCCSRNV